VRGAGREIRFQLVSREEAIEVRRAEHQKLLDAIRDFQPVSDGGLNLEALYNQNLITGVVDARV
jgi:hypothetical protein